MKDQVGVEGAAAPGQGRDTLLKRVRRAVDRAFEVALQEQKYHGKLSRDVVARAVAAELLEWDLEAAHSAHTSEPELVALKRTGVDGEFLYAEEVLPLLERMLALSRSHPQADQEEK